MSITYDKLYELAKQSRHMFEYENKKEYKELKEYFIYELMPEVKKEAYDAVAARERFNEIAAHAYEEAHPKTVWKVFWLYDDGFKDISAYSLEGEIYDEEENTIEMLASEYEVKPDRIRVRYCERLKGGTLI